MIDFKKLDKAQKMYSEIKIIDKQIAEIEKIAQIVVSGGSVEFSLSAKPVKESKKNLLDEDGSLIRDGHRPDGMLSLMFSYGCPPVKVEEPKNTIKENPSESVTM